MIYQYIIYVGSLPEEVVPFDAASSVPIEEQKEAAMLTIQKCLNSQQAARALALLRAARYTYTLYTTLHPLFHQCCGSASELDPYSGPLWILILNTDPEYMQKV